MYTAMIIDDEQWVIENLKESVDWTDQEFTVVGTATNGNAGFELIKELEPDIVFIDIRMPGMTGLECMKKSADLHLKTKFIVVSGFAEFSYVQKCLNLGASGYCLKPVDEGEISNLLQRVKEGLDAVRLSDTSMLLDWMIAGTDESLRQLERAFCHAGMKRYAEDGMYAAVCIGNDAGGIWKSYRHIKLRLGRKKTVYLLKDEPSRPIIDLGGRPTSAGCKGIGLSDVIHNLRDLLSEIDRADLAAHRYFITGEEKIYTADSLTAREDPRGSWEQTIRLLADELPKRDPARLNVLFEEYEQDLKKEQIKSSIREVYAFYSAAYSLILGSSSAGFTVLNESMLIGYDQLVDKYANTSEMVKELQKLASRQLESSTGHGREQARSDTFTALLQFVDENFFQNITLQSLSEAFYIHPNYISQLFKKRLGKSFTDYLTEIRISEACVLLREGSGTNQEIGEKVGIHDAFYFSRVFKKIKGVTPSEYRYGQGVIKR